MYFVLKFLTLCLNKFSWNNISTVRSRIIFKTACIIHRILWWRSGSGVYKNFGAWCLNFFHGTLNLRRQNTLTAFHYNLHSNFLSKIKAYLNKVRNIKSKVNIHSLGNIFILERVPQWYQSLHHWGIVSKMNTFAYELFWCNKSNGFSFFSTFNIQGCRKN